MTVAAMLAVVATLVTNPAPVSVSIVSPAELRRARTREMLTALKVDEARREAFRYERRKRILNKAASDLQRIAGPSTAVVSVSVDYKSGDILVTYADGYKFIQRYTPPEPVKPERIVRPKPAKKKEGW